MQGALDFINPAGQILTMPLGKGRDGFGDHATLEWMPHRLTWSIVATGDKVPVQVNGKPVGKIPVQLAHSAEILVGRVRARFLRIPDVPTLGGKPCQEVILRKLKLHIGRNEGAATESHGGKVIQRWLLDPDDDRETARVHVEISPTEHGYTIRDRSARGTYLNGDLFSEKPLVPGDRFDIGSYTFVFTGKSVCCVDSLLGASVAGKEIGLRVRHKGKMVPILQQIAIEIRAGEFIGILGGSGQGKTTLMNVLGGLLSPTRGRIWLDGEPLGAKLLSGGVIGFVPQDDIVHTELSVTQALTLTARLRLAVPRKAIKTLVTGIIDKLGLTEHAEKPVRLLSGGQRKRVNIATELFVRPAVLFLDEPTSGLDPENEEAVITTLQGLSFTGQTVVCTTHSLHKAFVFKRIAFIHDGRLLFVGNKDEARDHFYPGDKGTAGSATSTATSTDTTSSSFRLEGIYKKVKIREDFEALLAKFLRSPLAPFSGNAFPPERRIFPRAPRQPRPGFFRTMTVLVATQWRILTADRKNIKSLLLQAVGIGLLAGWAGREDPEFRFFACLIATLWFGCSNAAQTIVRELPIFRRERVAGLSLHPYILSKTLFLTIISWLQVVLLLVSQALPVVLSTVDSKNPAHHLLPMDGLPCFILAFALMGAVGVQIGLALSSMARTVTQATLWVPLALIPQILFSGFVVTRPEMPDSARIFSLAVPSASAQRLIDLANIEGKRLPVMTDDTEVPMFFWSNGAKPEKTAGTHLYSPPPAERQLKPRPPKPYRELDEYNTSWQNSLVDFSRLGSHIPRTAEEKSAQKDDDGDSDYVLERKDVLKKVLVDGPFESGQQMWLAAAALCAWSLISYIVTWLGLSMAQPAPLRPYWLRRVGKP